MQTITVETASDSGQRPVPSAQRATLSLLRLCQLVSPALPVGAYHFSQGLEHAVHVGWVKDELTAREWIVGIAGHSLATLDLPVLYRMHRGWMGEDHAAVLLWSRFLIAARETMELRAEDRHMGSALAKVLVELEFDEQTLIANESMSFASMFSLAAARWNIDAHATMAGYLWSWAENQVLAAVKLVPLGQSAGQRLLHHLVEQIPSWVTEAALLSDDEIGTSVPMHGIASASHETQYSRLFRS